VQFPRNFPIEDYREIFYTIYRWNVLSLQCKMGLRRSMTTKKVNPLSLMFINFNITALRPDLL
jgi:hypothetical protein